LGSDGSRKEEGIGPLAICMAVKRTCLSIGKNSNSPKSDSYMESFGRNNNIGYFGRAYLQYYIGGTLLK
jgi:hypothetical protein